MNYAELIAKHGMPEARRLWKEAQKAATRERERIRLAKRNEEAKAERARKRAEREAERERRRERNLKIGREHARRRAEREADQ